MVAIVGVAGLALAAKIIGGTIGADRADVCGFFAVIGDPVQAIAMSLQYA